MADRQTAVVAFRITAKEAKTLGVKAATQRIVNVRSGNQLARKIVLDFIHGKLNYNSTR